MADNKKQELEQNQQQLTSITQSFAESLDELDAARGSTVGAQFRECMRFHDENVMVRQDLLQTHALIQDQYRTEIDIRKGLAQVVKRLDPSQDDYIDRYNEIVSLQAKSTEILNKLNRTMTALKKEIRQTEFQSKFVMHVSIFHQFTLALHAIMFKHLQSTPHLIDISAEISKLARSTGLLGEGEVMSGLIDVEDQS